MTLPVKKAPPAGLCSALVVSSLVILLAACSADPYDRPSLERAQDTLQGHRDAATARSTTAAAEAIARGRTAEALAEYEKLYRTDKSNPVYALNYAQLLRRSERSDEALKVLRPFTRGRNAETHALVLNEYAAILIQQGQVRPAQQAIDSVLADDRAAPYHADAMNLLGVLLDAQGRHREAETMFRRALDGWHGNPTTVMNNLALCLANQARFDEALTTLRQALVMAPDKQDIARNIQLVSDLRDSVVSQPTPLR